MITGKQIKALKGYDSIVVRLEGSHGTRLEAISRKDGQETVTTITDDIATPQRGVWCYSYANYHDTNWQFFVQSLKPTDKVNFEVRNNSNQYATDNGLIVEEFQAVIRRKERVMRNTLQSHIVPSDYFAIFKQA